MSKISLFQRWVDGYLAKTICHILHQSTYTYTALSLDLLLWPSKCCLATYMWFSPGWPQHLSKEIHEHLVICTQVSITKLYLQYQIYYMDFQSSLAMFQALNLYLFHKKCYWYFNSIFMIHQLDHVSRLCQYFHPVSIFSQHAVLIYRDITAFLSSYNFTWALHEEQNEWHEAGKVDGERIWYPTSVPQLSGVDT